MGKKPVLGSLTGFFMNYCGKEDTLMAFIVLEKQRWRTGASSTSTVALSTASLSTSTRKPDAMHDFSPTIIPEELVFLS